VNFALYVEGATERAIPAFLKRWLDPKLSHPVGVKPVRFQGSGDYLKSFAQRAQRDLDSNRLIAVIGLLDLYRVPLTFPRNLTADAKYTWAKTELERRVGRPRFRQHFAVHETEAWLLAIPRYFQPGFEKAWKATRTSRNPSTFKNRQRSCSIRCIQPTTANTRKSLTAPHYSANSIRIEPTNDART
jgi:hypothetical protein